MIDPSYAAYRAGSAVARALPRPVVRPAAAAGGRLAALAMSGRRSMVARHQLRVRPDLTPDQLDRAVDQVFASYADYWMESFRLPGTSPAALDAKLRADGYEHLVEAHAGGRGVIFAMPHLGGYEWVAHWLTACCDLPVSTVVEPVEPQELADWFIGLRTSLGLDVIPLDGQAGTRVAKALNDGRVLGLMCDRDIAGSGIEVEFFGERTTLPAGPATLALRQGVPILPAACFMDGDLHVPKVLPPLDTARRGKLREDVARVTQDLADALESLIREAPEQWHLMQPNWPSDLAAEGG